MGIFVIRNLTVPCRMLPRCVKILSNNVFRTEMSKLHTIVRNDTLTSALKTSYPRVNSSFFGRRTMLVNPSSLRLNFNSKGNALLSVRFMASRNSKQNNDVVYYFIATGIAMLGMAYAGVPLYKIFCQQFGLGGNTELARVQNEEKVLTMERIPDRKLTVHFNADRHSSIQWNFKPQQQRIKISPGETALAFYRAENPTDKPVVGVATYSVVPYAAAPYFHKIQCFCFEEQILNPHEQVDMPVFFYIDPEFDVDPALYGENDLTLSYTFFEAKEGMTLPVPGSYNTQPHLYRQ